MYVATGELSCDKKIEGMTNTDASDNCDTGGQKYNSDSQGECPCPLYKRTYKTLNGCINKTKNLPVGGGRAWKIWCEDVCTHPEITETTIGAEDQGIIHSFPDEDIGPKFNKDYLLNMDGFMFDSDKKIKTLEISEGMTNTDASDNSIVNFSEVNYDDNNSEKGVYGNTLQQVYINTIAKDQGKCVVDKNQTKKLTNKFNCN